MRRVPIVLVVLAFVLAPPVGAAQARPPLIISAVPDVEAGAVVITGDRLAAPRRPEGPAPTPSVTLGGLSLRVTSFSRNRIRAELPSPSLAPGTHLLTVAPTAQASASAVFELAIPRQERPDAVSAVSSGKPGDWPPRRGNPFGQILDKLDELESQIAENRAAVEARLAAIDALLEDTAEAVERDQSCTPESVLDGSCDFLDMQANICVQLNSGASAGLSYGLSTRYSLAAGAGWPEVAWVKGTADLSIPAIVPVGSPIPFIPPVPVAVPVAIPDVSLKGSGSLGASMTVCFKPISLERRGEIPPPLQEFADLLVAQLSATADGVRTKSLETAEKLGLDPRAIQPALDGIQDLTDGTLVPEDTLGFFEGELRELANALPTGEPLDRSTAVTGPASGPPARSRLLAMLERPDNLIPRIDDVDCDNRPEVGPAVDPFLDSICGFLAGLPSVEAVKEAFEAFEPDGMVGEVSRQLTVREADTLRGKIFEGVDPLPDTGRDNGSVCREHAQCMSASYCSAARICKAKKPRGATCSRDVQCLSGDCSRSRGQVIKRCG